MAFKNCIFVQLNTIIMKKILLVALAILLVAPAFAKHKKTKKTRNPKSGIVSVTMRRTACFGRCPDYTIEINKNGMVTYTGLRFTPDTGIFQKKVTADQAMSVINQLTLNKVDTCRNLYENRIPDLPGIIYMVKYQDSTKRISNANWGPVFLKTIADDMDKIGKKTAENDAEWKKVTEHAPKKK